MEKVWYEVNEINKPPLSDLKELGFDGLYINDDFNGDVDQLKSEAKLTGLDVMFAKDKAFNDKLANLILEELKNESQIKIEFTSIMEKELHNDKLIGLTQSAIGRQLILFQAVALMALLPGDLLIPAQLEEKKGSQSWRKLKALISLRKKYKTSEESKLNVTEDNLLRIKRGKLIGYFNTTPNALGFNSENIWIQNYLVGQLLPKGVVIKEDEK